MKLGVTACGLALAGLFLNNTAHALDPVGNHDRPTDVVSEANLGSRLSFAGCGFIFEDGFESGDDGAWIGFTRFMSQQLGFAVVGTSEDTGQDRYEFQVNAGTYLEITASTDGYLDAEIYFYAPGAAGVGQTNLLTGTPFGLDTAGVGGEEQANITVFTTGAYNLAVEDGRTASSQSAGCYTLVANANAIVGQPTRIVDEGPESD